MSRMLGVKPGSCTAASSGARAILGAASRAGPTGVKPGASDSRHAL